MSFAHLDGSPADLPRPSRCPIWHVSRRYLSRARSVSERHSRRRRLMAIAGRVLFGLSDRELSGSLSLNEDHLARGLEQTLGELRGDAEALGYSADVLFPGRPAFEAGSGI